MRETAQDLSDLQGLLDHSVGQAGAFLRESMQLDIHTLAAKQVVRYLDGIRTASLATVTAKGEPRVAPIAAIFYRGRYHVPTVVNAARARHLRQRRGVSLTEYAGHDNAVTIHGQATLIGLDHPDFEAVDDAYAALSTNGGPRNWGGGGPLYIRVDPDVMYATAIHPEEYPE